MEKAPTSLRNSLRFRILGPLVAAALVVAVAVAAVSQIMGSQAAERQIDERFEQLQLVLNSPTYPLSPSVLTLLADLTNTQLATLNADQAILNSTLPAIGTPPADQTLVTLDGRQYRSRRINLQRSVVRQDGVRQIVVLFDLEQLLQRRRQAACLPLLTGIATVLILTGVWFALAARIIRRIVRLQHRFAEIAAGQFQQEHHKEPADELGQLAVSANEMSRELARLWNELGKQQSEKVMHQVAAGMAHQLRNSLTGARMAIELALRHGESAETENLNVALTQMEQSENYVQQLLMVASGKLAGAVRMPLDECFGQLQTTFAPVAQHLHKELHWSLPDDLSAATVREGSTLIAAVSNLVQNAIQAGDRVWVEVERHNGRLLVTVADDGPGVGDSVAQDIFEPFVTSKPEGLGLGLAVVRRAAQTLDGRVDFRRHNQRTEFQFECLIQS